MNTQKTDIKVSLPKGEKFLIPVNEIAACQLVNHFSEQEITEFAKSPKENLFAMFDVETPNDFTINVVKNSEAEVHLTLPFYESFDGINVDELSDDEIADASGGEIICISIGAIIGTKIAAILGAQVGGIFLATGGALTLTTFTLPASLGAALTGTAIGGIAGAGVAATAGAIVTGGVLGARAAAGEK